MRFRKKPVVIDAFRVGIDPWPEWAWNKVNINEIRLYGPYRDLSHVIIRTLEGQMQAIKGDYVIRGVKGEIYSCKPDIFAATYEPVNESESGKPDALRDRIDHTV